MVRPVSLYILACSILGAFPGEHMPPTVHTMIGPAALQRAEEAVARAGVVPLVSLCRSTRNDGAAGRAPHPAPPVRRDQRPHSCLREEGKKAC
jgi:hypothetical protein